MGGEGRTSMPRETEYKQKNPTETNKKQIKNNNNKNKTPLLKVYFCYKNVNL